MPVPDDARFQHVCSEDATKEEVGYEYLFPPTTLVAEKARQGWTNTELDPGAPPPYPRVTAGTGGGDTSTTP